MVVNGQDAGTETGIKCDYCEVEISRLHSGDLYCGCGVTPRIVAEVTLRIHANYARLERIHEEDEKKFRC